VLIRDLELFAGSLLDNLDPRLIPSDGPSIRGVLDLVGLGERVDELPEGVQTHLLPTGWPLRKLEARRLMLGQAFIREPRLLIIDGGLDGLGLSATARARVLDRLMAADAPWTLIVVSDDPAVLHGCTQTLESS
jgi:putative ABC transport system ATP-binding protein